MYTKIDNQTLEVSESKVEVVRHNISDLKQQLEHAKERKLENNKMRDAEIAELEKLLGEAGKLGIVETVVEPTE